MATFREWIVRLWGTVRRNPSDRDLEQELRSHLDLAAADARFRGISHEGAVRVAGIEAGGIAQAMEAVRDQRGLPWLTDLIRDVRYGCRMLARNPGFTTIAVVSMAIGIGVNCAVFSFADALLLRPLAVPHPGQVVRVGSATPSLGGSLVASYREYVDIRDRSESFDGLVASREATVAFAGQPGDAPTPRVGLLVSGNFFSVMQVEPQWGRAFRLDEDRVPGRDAVVVLGHEFWTQQLGADPSILGHTVYLNGIAFTVIGVAPSNFTGISQFTRSEFFVPLMMWPRLLADATSAPLEARDLRSLGILGRLKSDKTMSAAQTEISRIAKDLELAYPATNRNRPMAVRTELNTRVMDSPPLVRLLALLALLATAVLFVACANVAGLLTSRAPMRAREIALRMAMGAGRLRIVRQLITESVLIATLGGALGLGVGFAGVTLFRQFQIPTDLPITVPFQLNTRALLATFVVALLSACFFGLAPAIRSVRTDLTAVMKATDAAGLGRRRRWGRASLVGGQVAVAVVLLVVAAFAYRGFQQRLEKGPGFRTDHVLMSWFSTSLVQYNDAQAQQFFEQVVERAARVPGVKSAALTSYVPMDGGVGRIKIVPEGFEIPAGTETVAVPNSVVSERYFETIGLPILHGRDFRATDTIDSSKVAIVNESLALHYWPGEDPLGKRFRLNDAGGPWVEVVGLAKVSHYVSVFESAGEFAYFPYRQRPQPVMALLTESNGDPTDLVSPLREVVRGLDPNVPMTNVRTLEENYRLRAVVIVNIVVRLVGAMGTMGLALAIVGLYGLVAYAAGRRTKEIGIRMAIGAGRSEVLRMVLRQGMVLALAGLAVGLLASVGVSRALTTVFPGGVGGDGRTDFVAFGLVATTVLAVTLLAAYIPARRASRINPTEALRCE